jgi:hypothetical protein
MEDAKDAGRATSLFYLTPPDQQGNPPQLADGGGRREPGQAARLLLLSCKACRAAASPQECRVHVRLAENATLGITCVSSPVWANDFLAGARIGASVLIYLHWRDSRFRDRLF